MKIKHQMIHKFTGEVTANGDTYSPDCIVEGLENIVDVTLRFDESEKIGTADNFVLENGVLFADLDLVTDTKILDRSYVVPQFFVLDPLYDFTIPEEDYLKKSLKRVKILSLGCVSNPSIKNLDRLKIIKEEVL